MKLLKTKLIGSFQINKSLQAKLKFLIFSQNNYGCGKYFLVTTTRIIKIIDINCFTE